MIYSALQKPLLTRGLPPWMAILDPLLFAWVILAMEATVFVMALLYVFGVRPHIEVALEKEPYWLPCLVQEWRYRPFYSGGTSVVGKRRAKP